MDASLLTDEDRKRWREMTLEHLRNYPEFGKFNGDEKYTLIEGSADRDVRWAADEIVRLERELGSMYSAMLEWRRQALDQARIAELDASDAKDAARYRYLRGAKSDVPNAFIAIRAMSPLSAFAQLTGTQADLHVDAAMNLERELPHGVEPSRPAAQEQGEKK